jgi:excisionase family DNA binding protein
MNRATHHRHLPSSLGRRGGGLGDPAPDPVPPALGGLGGHDREERMTDERKGASVEPLLLRVDEAAIVLGIGRTKVFEMLASGDLPAIRIGRCVRVPKDRLERWIDEQSNAQAEAFLVANYLQSGLTADGQRITLRSKR